MNRTPKWKRVLPSLAAGVVLVALVGLSIYFLRDFLGGKVEAPKKVVQEVRIIRPPPPPETQPPPPPPPEEEVDLPDPEQQPDPTPSNEPPAGEHLGVDAVGTGAGDGFGLIGRPGGRDLLASGGNNYAQYAGLIKNEILNRLEDEKKARSGSYSVTVRLWVRRDGSIERASLMGSSGDKDRDRAIEDALARLTRLSQAPPADMPQPITLRIVSRA